MDCAIDGSTFTVDAFYEGLRSYAATIDELLTASIEPARGRQEITDLTARRLAAWCRSSAAGDDALFARRLERDGSSLPEVRERLGTVRPDSAARIPAWVDDAVWIEVALQNSAATDLAQATTTEPCAFEELLLPLVAQAQERLWGSLDAAAAGNLNEAARASLSLDLLQRLSALCAPALYDRFAKARNSGTGYRQFVAAMTMGGFRALFEAKPVLLRLLATLIRQWIETTGELIGRLADDLPAIRHELLRSDGGGRVAAIEGNLSDPHNFGRSVQIIRFEDGARVVYKPKDLRLDVAWHALIERLNRAEPPVTLKAVRAIARDGYGWTEFIDHIGCADETGCARFFRRAGAWLAVLHVFVATDMHQENMIATGEHPVPVDLETILQPAADEQKIQDPEGEAFNAAMDIIANSVMTVGLLPAYGRSVDNSVFAMGGMTADWGARTVITWNDVNSDAMRPARAQEAAATNTNLPHVDGRYAKFADHVEGFVAGFADYAAFLRRQTQNGDDFLLAGFAGVPVRKVIRPTRFYYMLLQRLKDHRSMDDGAVWSAQADFVARLAEWDNQSDPLWPLHRAERMALTSLNVPHFVVASDGDEITDNTGVTVRTAATPGLARARARLAGLDDREIAWQVEIIRENTNSIVPAKPKAPRPPPPASSNAMDATAAPSAFRAEADRIAAELSGYAIRRGPGAAWIGLDWLGDSEVFQLVCLGPDLYNGSTGIALFLAAHAAASGDAESGELAGAGIAQLRKSLKGRNAPRLARTLGIGAATGLGSIVYAFTVMAKLLERRDLVADAQAAAELFTDELIAADKQFDVMGGAAGAVLALLRLYRDSASADVLRRAVKCGEHLLAQRRVGIDGRRIWVGQGLGAKALAQGLNGMSHGAAGFAYALSSLAAAADREDFAAAAAECLAFEDASYDAERHNWPDWRGSGAPTWPCQWCHGAPGIGLARLGMKRFGTAKCGGQHPDAKRLAADIRNAAAGVAQAAPGTLDTLCCGTLGRIEFMCEAAGALERTDLRELAAQRLLAVLTEAAATGDYRWNSGKRQFNLGLFRGLSGVGYTLLRQASLLDGKTALPNVLIWE